MDFDVNFSRLNYVRAYRSIAEKQSLLIRHCNRQKYLREPTDDCRMSSFKRRKLSQKLVDFPSEENARANQHVNLPQKKRAIIRSSSPTKSPVKKQLRSNSITNSTEDVTDDETLIREAEVALKNLSGSWPSSRNSIYNSEITNENEFEPPAFENLFEENQVSRIDLSDKV